MKARHHADGTIMVSGSSGEEQFERIWAGIGVSGADPGYLSVVGERTDGRYHALWEAQGSLSELGEAATEAKNRLLVDLFWIDGSDEIVSVYFRALAGLTGSPVGQKLPLRSLYEGKTKAPPLRESEHDAVIASVPDRVVSHFPSALDMTRGLINRGKLLVHAQNCPVLLYTLRQPVDDIVSSPISRALVWVLHALEMSTGPDDPLSDCEDRWYENFRRGRHESGSELKRSLMNKDYQTV